MEQELVIQRAHMNHIEEVYKLFEGAKVLMEAQGIHQWDELYPNREDFEADIKDGTMYLVRLGEVLAGVFVLSQECDEEYHHVVWEGTDETCCILHRFCITADLQNQGIGTGTLKRIEEKAKELGYTSVRLDAFTENPYSLRMYHKAGYQDKGFADWRKGRFVLMEKVL